MLAPQSFASLTSLRRRSLIDCRNLTNAVEASSPTALMTLVLLSARSLTAGPTGTDARPGMTCSPSDHAALVSMFMRHCWLQATTLSEMLALQRLDLYCCRAPVDLQERREALQPRAGEPEKLRRPQIQIVLNDIEAIAAPIEPLRLPINEAAMNKVLQERDRDQESAIRARFTAMAWSECGMPKWSRSLRLSFVK